MAIRELVGDETVKVVEAPSAAEGLAALRDQEIGCIILDLMLPDMSGFKLIEQIRAEHQQLPVIIYTGKDLSRKERSEEHTSELQSLTNLVCRLLLEKKKANNS